MRDIKASYTWFTSTTLYKQGSLSAVDHRANLASHTPKFTDSILADQPSTSQELTAFQRLKEVLFTATVLACPDFEKTFVLQVDVSNYGGAALTQTVDGKEVVIAYAS